MQLLSGLSLQAFVPQGFPLYPAAIGRNNKAQHIPKMFTKCYCQRVEVQKNIIFIPTMTPVRHIEQAADDDTLLKAYQASLDQNTLATLYLRYKDLVFGTCMKYLKNEDASSDAVMNIYQELVQKLHKHQIGNFKGWLYMVTKNHCLMQLRKDKKTVTVEFQPTFMQSEDFSHLDNVLEKERNLQSLENCIEGLNTEQQRTIKLFYLEEKCYNEIAAETGIEWNKVRSLIQYGRRNLKICMEGNG